VENSKQMSQTIAVASNISTKLDEVDVFSGVERKKIKTPEEAKQRSLKTRASFYLKNPR